MAAVASEAIDAFPVSERHFRGITGSFSSEAYGKIRDEINACAERVLRIIAGDTGETKLVHQLNMQLFPLQKKPRRGRRRS
jgi:uncharacterized protein (TIGR02147 family)